ncbi:porin [Paraburkholderia monticola]|uniref:porin n=1 Tax=Paraburkholderia monticola TaxID=1399968 RepID=UPI0007803568|nr:porin [Paraburkholderia monticola]
MKKEIFAAVCACFLASGSVSAQEGQSKLGAEEAQSPLGYDLVSQPVSGDGMPMTGNAVQLYGLLTPTIAYTKSTGARSPGVNGPAAVRFASNGSFWGIRGTEDLGGGWQAIFQYENTINLGTGTNTNASGTFAGRDTFVGVQSDKFGVLEMGYLTSPLYNTVGIYKFLGDQLPIASTTTLMTTLNGTSLQFNQRVAGAVLYSTSKDSEGLVGHFLYSNNQSDPSDDTPAGRVYTLSGSYGAGPLYLQYVYESRLDQNKLAASGNDWDHRIVGRYSFTPTFAVAFGLDYAGSDGTYGKKAAMGDGRVSRQAATISFAKNLGRHELIASYGIARGLNCSGAAANVSASCLTANQSSTGAQQASLVYEYQFSKRTSVATYVSRIWNRSQGLYDFDSTPVVQSVSARSPGADPLGFGVGILTTF